MSAFLKKLVIVLLIFLFLILILLILLLLESKDNLEVIFFDVGQGDSILIKTPSSQHILIDGGPDSRVVGKLSQYLSFYDHRINLMILTHPHADHVTGLIEVLKRFKVEKVLLTGVLHTTPAYLEWLTLIQEKNILRETIRGKKSINLSPDFKIEILWPQQDLTSLRVEELNDTSIVTRFIFGQVSILLMGDASSLIEAELMSQDLDLQASVLKIAHQGAKDATTEEFLKVVQPEIAIISVGENKFGHPSWRVLKRLERAGIKTFRTDRNGDVIIQMQNSKCKMQNCNSKLKIKTQR